ncbi:MAG: hypothetical protein M3Q48_16970 [Actinomycetota bacterium]|nr:hypothetical protein [Actinomycetota bacterium]
MEGLVFGVLIFVFGTLFVANAWGVIDAKLAATAAAREAARTFVEAPSAAAAWSAAERAGLDAIAAHGRQRERAKVIPVESTFARCSPAVVEVQYQVPLAAIPLFGQYGRGLTVTARHSEVVDPYRSGVPGEAECRPR